MGVKTYHMGLSVRGALNWDKREAKKNCKWIKINGKQPTVDELRHHLMDLLAKGVEVVPYGKCDNWDDKEGCRGHAVDATKAG
jgi:hypothetical protein